MKINKFNENSNIKLPLKKINYKNVVTNEYLVANENYKKFRINAISVSIPRYVEIKNKKSISSYLTEEE